ncbi:hypothetical protein DWY47_15595 [Ruminococcus sp. AF25-23LB]|nr:hypothetical protein DWY47_15595 [Ruminococcus sp. AF25-23LB]
MLLLIPFLATCFSIFAVSEKTTKKLQTDIIYYRIISMEKQQNMPSGYEKDRKLLVNIKSFH